MRFVVLERHTSEQVRDAAVQLARTGMTVRSGWRVPSRPDAADVVCVGRVIGRDDCAAAVLAALAGASLVVDAHGCERDLIDPLCDDLRRIGELDHRVEAPRDLPLNESQQQLLALLMGGATLGQAARALHLSRRTADRRLAAARRALGVASTSEAVTVAGRLGISPR